MIPSRLIRTLLTNTPTPAPAPERAPTPVSPHASSSARQWDRVANSNHPRCDHCGLLLSPKRVCVICEDKP